MVTGGILKTMDQQYVARRDASGTWRVLNNYHPELHKIDITPDTEIPDEHPAVTVITEGAFIAIVKEAVALGLVDFAYGENVPKFQYDEVVEKSEKTVRDHSEQVEKLKAEIAELRAKKKDEDLDNDGERSEEFLLQRHALNTVLKIVGVNKIP